MQKPETLETPVHPTDAPPQAVFAPPTPLLWRLAILAAILAVGITAYITRETIGLRGQAVAGLIFFFGIVAAFSANLRAVNWRTIGWGITLQLILATLVLSEGRPYQVVAWVCFAAMVGAWALAHIAPAARGQGVRWPGLLGGAVALAGAYLVFFTVGVRRSFEHVGDLVKAFITFSDKGAQFVFGNLANPADLQNVFARDFLFPFAFKALPPILFVSAFFTVLYHFGVLQWCVRMLAVVMVHLMRTSGAETLSVAANVFMGQTEAPLIVKPYVPRMTNSELFALMASGMAHISGGMMVVYINYGADPVAVLTTCVMACPCSLYLSKLFLPELSVPETAGTVQTKKEKSPYVNAVDAAASGTQDGLRLALNVGAMLIVFIAFVAMFDALLASVKPSLVWLMETIRQALLGLGVSADNLSAWPDAGSFTGWPDDLSLEKVFGWMFAPVAFLMGVSVDDVQKVGSLLGQKLAINEHYAYLQMKALKAMTEPQMSARSYQLTAFALTGFANFSSVGIQLGGIGAMAPNRRHDLARLGMRALFIGFTATLLNAAIAGVLLNP